MDVTFADVAKRRASSGVGKPEIELDDGLARLRHVDQRRRSGRDEIRDAAELV